MSWSQWRTLMAWSLFWIVAGAVVCAVAVL